MDTPPSPAARTIAAGGNPAHTFELEHPEHGPLTFTWKMPLSVDSLRHSVEVDNLLQDLSPGVDPSYQTRVIAAAIAGMTVPEGNPAGKALMLSLPVVSREPDPDDEGRIKVTYYDAKAESHLEFLHDVWTAFSLWRQGLLSDATVEQVGESSGGPVTSSDGSSTPSAEATAPPAPTTAS